MCSERGTPAPGLCTVANSSQQTTQGIKAEQPEHSTFGTHHFKTKKVDQHCVVLLRKPESKNGNTMCGSPT